MYLVMTYFVRSGYGLYEGWEIAAEFETEREAREWANLEWVRANRTWEDIMIVKHVASREDIEKL